MLPDQIESFVRLLKVFLQLKNSLQKFYTRAAKFKNLLFERSDTLKKFGVDKSGCHFHDLQ